MKHLNYYSKTFILAAVMMVAGVHGFSQVGFNNPNPDSSALLDLKAHDKGLLIPRMTTVDRTNMNIGGKTPAHALLVFDINQNMFFAYDTISNPDRWLALNPWITQGAANPDITIATTGNVGIGTNSPTEKLEVNGNIKSDGTITSTGTISTAGSIVSSGITTGNISSSGNIIATGNIIANKFIGDGTVPAGGIIMWSGTTAPTGWVLCDGNNGTPDLRQRFIVGTGDSPSLPGTGYEVDDIGGADVVTLTAAESGLPNHSHYVPSTQHNAGLSTTNFFDSAPNGTESVIPTTGVIGGAQNASQAHENRPPYYALAYIMKL